MSLSDSDSSTATTTTGLDDERRLLEALLFAALSPLDATTLKERLPEGTDIAALLDELVAFYAPRGVNIVQVAGGWTIRTAPDLAPRLKLTQKVGRKLSRAAIETLAIVAYHQPATRAEIEEIRGVAISKGTLDMLMEAGWIVPKGRKETVGRPVTWVTTDAFLQHFGLNSIADLPGIDELRATGLIGPRPVSTLSETIGVPDGERLPDAIEDVEHNDMEEDMLEETQEFAPLLRSDAIAVVEAAIRAPAAPESTVLKPEASELAAPDEEAADDDDEDEELEDDEDSAEDDESEDDDDEDEEDDEDDEDEELDEDEEGSDEAESDPEADDEEDEEE